MNCPYVNRPYVNRHYVNWPYVDCPNRRRSACGGKRKTMQAGREKPVLGEKMGFFRIVLEDYCGRAELTEPDLWG